VTWNQWLELLSLAEVTDPNQSGLLQNDSQRFVGDVIEHSNRELLAISDLQQGLSVCASPADGGEISSLVVYEKGQCHELLYRANDFTQTDEWPGRAPWLWPVAGRCYVADQPRNECTWNWDGTLRPMERHGFARHLAWNAIAPTMAIDNVTCGSELRSGNNYQDIYPFNYELTTRQQLSDDGLGITYRVVASPGNAGVMPFCLGLHFTFNFSTWWGNDWLAGTVEGLGTCGWRTDDQAQPSTRFELPPGPILLSDSSLSSAIIPACGGAPVKLVSPNGDRWLAMSFDESLGINDGDITWVSYVDSQKRFFCLEPWVGWPNAINSGRGRVELEPGQTWEFRLQMTIAAVRSASKQEPPAR
jgi:galactose mutarotase-like enzyme